MNKSITFNLNPIIVKEFRSRMRGWRAFAVLTAYLLFLGLFGYGIYQVVLYTMPYTSGMPLSPFLGQTLHSALANLSLFFVAFLTPALTATAISSEYEKLTIEMLQATPLAPHTILIGKLISTASYIFLLLFAAIPMVSLIFLFGGVTLPDLLLTALIIISTALTFGMVGLFFSAWRKRTIQALVLTYLVILLLIGGTYAIYIFWGAMAQDFPPRAILLFNPFSALAAVLSNNGSQAGLSGIFGFIAGGGPFMNNPAEIANLRPLWHYTLAFYLVLSTVLYFLTTRFIRPIRPWRLTGREVLVFVAVTLMFIGAGGLIFYRDIDRALNPPPETPTPTPLPFGPMPIMVEPAVPVPTAAPPEEATEEAGDEASESPAPAATGEAE